MMKSEYKKYTIVMMLCFLLGGFSIFFFLLQVYSNFWSMEVVQDIRNFSNVSFNSSIDGRSLGQPPPVGRFPLSELGITERMSSPMSLMILVNGIILLIGGISIWFLTREREIVKAREKITSLLLLPDERTILDELKKSHGSITQSQLVRKTGMNKVKVHRTVRRLASKGIVSKHEYGLTNKIVLEKDFG